VAVLHGETGDGSENLKKTNNKNKLKNLKYLTYVKIFNKGLKGLIRAYLI
jgi:hypothetical protein